MNVQAEAPFRMTADGVKQLRVRNAEGQMVPLGTVADIRDSSGPVMLSRATTCTRRRHSMARGCPASAADR